VAAKHAKVVVTPVPIPTIPIAFPILAVLCVAKPPIPATQHKLEPR
jgi:hypothetical protein